MRRFASLFSLAMLTAAFSSAHASSINPLTDGFNLSVGNTVLSSNNATFDVTRGLVTFSDATSTYTFAEVNLSPLVNALSITRTCLTLNLAGCSSAVISVSNASVLNGTLQASALVGATLNASATAGVSNLVFASTSIGLGVETALVGYPAGSAPTGSSPVPEPGTLGLMASGLLGAAGAVRRRFVS